MPSYLEPLAQMGSIGVILAVSLYALRTLYNELSGERAARIQDAKDSRDLLLRMQQAQLDAIDKLTDLYEQIRDERRSR